MSTFALVSLVNDRAQFEACQTSLRADASPFPEWLMVEPNKNGWNAAQGLNHGIERMNADWIVCVHQDVLFPAGFWQRLTAALRALPAEAAVAGIVGCEKNGRFRGHIVDPNGHCFWPPLPCEVATIDEVVIAVRKSSKLRFSEDVPGFHCYGADICYTARERGLKVFAIDAPLLHLSTGKLDASYERASQWLLAKWGPKYGHVLAMPTIVVKDEAKSGFVNRFLHRWRRRQDRLARNTNRCAGAVCAARSLGERHAASRSPSGKA